MPMSSLSLFRTWMSPLLGGDAFKISVPHQTQVPLDILTAPAHPSQEKPSSACLSTRALGAQPRELSDFGGGGGVNLHTTKTPQLLPPDTRQVAGRYQECHCCCDMYLGDSHGPFSAGLLTGMFSLF